MKKAKRKKKRKIFKKKGYIISMNKTSLFLPFLLEKLQVMTRRAQILIAIHLVIKEKESQKRVKNLNQKRKNENLDVNIHRLVVQTQAISLINFKLNLTSYPNY